MEQEAQSVVTATLGNIAAEAANALKDAAKEYGPEAVDLGLTVVRIGAVSDLAFSLMWVIILSLPIVMFLRFGPVRALRGKETDFDPDDWDTEAVFRLLVVMGFMVVVALFFLAHHLSSLLDIFLWAAVFGMPEALLAKNALTAAGLM